MTRLILFGSIILISFGCNSRQTAFAEINGITQGTTYHIVFEDAPNRNLSVIRQKVEQLLIEIDNSLSIYNDSSVISLINRNISDITDTLFREVYRQSRDIWEQSGGAFDITVGPLVKAWGFGPDAIKRFDESKLDSLLALVGMEKIRL